ncbi:hypothetical protein DRB17_07275 [Ferruginivarius sediminum]|uniref:Uncharacterized protein n=1 Tax=Ferruginivarius sediminum TaxID=2661937 RepID=A0A369TD38_9PROT|nr:hypothetical protein DRB17_07275 [Ferruginivarius sediminum]
MAVEQAGERGELHAAYRDAGDLSGFQWDALACSWCDGETEGEPDRDYAAQQQALGPEQAFPPAGPPQVAQVERLLERHLSPSFRVKIPQ